MKGMTPCLIQESLLFSEVLIKLEEATQTYEMIRKV